MEKFNLIFLLFGFVLCLLNVAKLFKFRPSSFSRKFVGDFQSLYPANINQVTPADVFFGDISSDDLDDDDEDADDLNFVTGDLTNRSNPNDFITGSVITGNIDEEWARSQLTQGDLITGGLFKRKRKKLAKAASSLPSTSTLVAPLNRFPAGMVTKQAVKAAVANANGAVGEAQLNQVAMQSGVRGALLQDKQISRLAIIGGSISQSDTLLKIVGSTFVTALDMYEALYPGLSRSTSAIAPSTGIVSLAFAAPSTGDVTKIIAVILQFTASSLQRAENAEIGVVLTGKINTATVTFTRDRFKIFADGNKATTIVMLPTIAVRQQLYLIPFDVPAASPSDLTIALTGVPEGTQVVARAPGQDSTEFSDYKAMLGL